MKNLVILSITALLILSCSKVETVTNNQNKKSLSEFIELVPNEEKEFLAKTKIIHNDYSFYNNKKGIVIEEIPMTVQWGFKYLNCTWYGVCTIGFPIANQNNQIIKIKLLEDNKLLFELNNSDGLTSEGYLPFSKNFELNDVFEYDNVTIKQGIYKANFNSETNNFGNVIVDLI